MRRPSDAPCAGARNTGNRFWPEPALYNLLHLLGARVNTAEVFRRIQKA